METTLDSSAPCSSTRRPGGKGRKKIVMAPIPDKNKQQVTFSKRRSGMFKKAGELCVLCGVEIAIIIFSPGGRLFCFGHPNAEATVNRYLTSSTDQTLTLTEPGNGGGDEAQIIEAYNCHYEQTMQELEKEKMKRKSSNNGGLGFWWEENVNVEAMAGEELMQYTAALEELRSMVMEVESYKNDSQY